MRSAAVRFSERISDSSRRSSSIRSGGTPSTTSWSPFSRKGSLSFTSAMSIDANPRALPCRASPTSSVASAFELTEPITKMRLSAETAWTAVIREEESVVAANVPPTAMRRATTFVKIVMSPPFARTA